jgi:hypothetical protein
MLDMIQFWILDFRFDKELDKLDSEKLDFGVWML